MKPKFILTTLLTVGVVALITNFVVRGSVYQAIDRFFAQSAQAGKGGLLLSAIGAGVASLGGVGIYLGLSGKGVASHLSAQQIMSVNRRRLISGIFLVVAGIALLILGLTL